MTESVVLHFSQKPSAAKYMALAFVGKRGRKDEIHAPVVNAVWSDFCPASVQPSSVRYAHPINLQASSVRLSMSILTHPKFPVPIWRILQNRNRIIQRWALSSAAKVTMEASLKDTRVLTKGVEFDIHVTMMSGAEIVFESINTFYAKGTFKGGQPEPVIAQPEPPLSKHAGWTISRSGVWSFARLTGDYNGIHWSNSYAKIFGFRSAFAHPHRALMSIIEHLPNVSIHSPLQLNAWFKGPVYYSRPLTLSHRKEGDTLDFALRVEGDERPAILGSLSELRS
ncbi:MAG: MaoC family dehydratase [Candidatus Acidiferrales bacterium]|jgi:hypothetical protein